MPHYAVISILPLDRIKDCLANFPKKGASRRACSTVVWSGTWWWDNTPLMLHNDDDNGWNGGGGLGVVLDPNRLGLNQADFYAQNSFGCEEQEIDKDGAVLHPVLDPEARDYTTRTVSSKYPYKKGYIRMMSSRGGGVWATNHARWDMKRKVYLPEGNFDIFASNVMRKFSKTKGGLHKNEALVYQKPNSPSPIDGLLITKNFKPDYKKHLVKILGENNNQKLYFYDRFSRSNILRYMSNKEAMKFLKSKDTFSTGFTKASYFHGYQLSDQIVSAEEESASSMSTTATTTMQQKNQLINDISAYITKKEQERVTDLFSNMFLPAHQQKVEKVRAAGLILQALYDGIELPPSHSYVSFQHGRLNDLYERACTVYNSSSVLTDQAYVCP